MSAESGAAGRRPLRVGLDMRLTVYRSGGISRYAEQLAQALGELDDVEMVPYYSNADERARGGRRLRTPPHHRLEEWTLSLEVLVSRERLDVFQSPDFISPRLIGCLRIATVHDLAFHTWPGFLAPDALAYYNRLDKSRYWTDGWITPSRWTADALQSAYDIPAERVAIIPHGVPPQLADTQAVPFEAREGFILAVGTVEPRKNYDLLLDALAEMSDPPPLVVAGAPGWQSDATQDRLRTTPGVEWHENADDALLRRLYRSAIAVVVPSHAEGFGFSALEAMVHGTPVISSGTGAMPEVTGDAALTPEAMSSDAWARAIARLREDRELWNTLAGSGVTRARRFTWEAAARKTVAFYRRLG